MKLPNDSFTENSGLARLRDLNLRRIADIARRDGLDFEVTKPDELRLKIAIPQPSGLQRHFFILVERHDKRVAAREDPRVPQLPACCPERHINSDGRFCTYYADGSSIDLETDNGAAEWVTALVAFLLRQIEAECSRTWSPERAWAHGNGARHQAEAERLAQTISPRFAALVRQRRLSVSKDDMTLLLDGRRLLTKARTRDAPRLINGRSRCPCAQPPGRTAHLRRDCVYQSTFIELIDELVQMHRQEEIFFAQLRNKHIKCCKTMDNCPLDAVS